MARLPYHQDRRGYIASVRKHPPREEPIVAGYKYESDGGEKPKKWIAGAITHPGALHRQLGVPEGKKIPAGKLAKAAQSGGTLGRRARLAQTLKKLHK